MQKIQKGDQVIVIAGKDKGKKGTILRVLEGKVLVEGVNMVKKHQKPNPMRNIAGGIETKSMPLDISNVAIFNPETQKADRVAIKEDKEEVQKNGKIKYKTVLRTRVYKSTGKPIVGA